MRFGSLHCFDSIKGNVAKISKRVGFPYTTVRSALNRFVQAGNIWKQKLGAPKKKIPKEVEEKLISAKCLQDMAAYSLRERVIMIERDMGYKMSYNFLHAFYHRNNIKPRQTKWVYRQANY